MLWTNDLTLHLKKVLGTNMVQHTKGNQCAYSIKTFQSDMEAWRAAELFKRHPGVSFGASPDTFLKDSDIKHMQQVRTPYFINYLLL